MCQGAAHQNHWAPVSGVATAVTGPLWGNFVDSGASRKWLLQATALYAESMEESTACDSNFELYLVVAVSPSP